MKFTTLAISNPSDLVFGHAPHPVTTHRGLVFGGGHVYPELNFTLPPMEVNTSTFPAVVQEYRDIVTGSLNKALHLHSKGVVLEFETLIEMTRTPAIGIEIVKVLNDLCEEYYHKHGLKSAIRLTPNDLREFERPPKLRSSRLLEPMFELFEKGAIAGGDLLSIESTGGKEISDDALLTCNIQKFIFSQAVLGVRDMQVLWRRIVDVAEATGRRAGGDTACGFANTAMVLAEKKYIPKVFAAVARIATVVRTLVAVEQGAMGPDKDCGYEGPYLKAIAGIPISMLGKTSACAHTSPVGNIGAACCDLWSNESVQNVKLLSGFAPVVYMEQLEYDVRLFNRAITEGRAMMLTLQRLMVDSDCFFDPQAFVLAPEVVIDVASKIVEGENYIDATKRGCLRGIELMEEAIASGKLLDDRKEAVWIAMLKEQIAAIPDNESDFVEMMLPMLDPGKVALEEYGL
ncbi:MAG TPA: methyltransferase MtaB domain-containing protein [Acidobacteriota bacterium]|nr:methyltransferase MtaB domain-containing protein [Acidobacteriota bacterium]